MVKCSNCGAWNNDSNNFCSNCANDLRKNHEITTGYSKLGEIKCSKCGTINTNVNFCGFCGNTLQNSSIKSSSDVQRKSPGRQLIHFILLVIFGTLFLKGLLDFYELVFYVSPYFYTYDFDVLVSLAYMGVGLFGGYFLIKNQS